MTYVRGYCLLLATYSMPAMVVERVLATILLKDYEFTPRPYIPVIIGVIELGLSTFSMYLYYQSKNKLQNKNDKIFLVEVKEIFILLFILVLDVAAFVVSFFGVYK